MNLQDYFNRIQFSGSPQADLATLKALHALHPASIAFENIDVLMDKGVPLLLGNITEKLINRQRGGYCFEQNYLLMEVMRKLGFEVEPLMARVVWQLPPDAPAGPKTHMVLRTVIDDTPWLVDVGFGGLVLTAPLQLIADMPQATQHETFRFIQCGLGLQLEVCINQQWQPVYHIGPETQQPIDIEVANWYTSAHPQSKFRHNLMAARATDQTRYTLLNKRLSIRRKGEAPVRRELTTDELMTALTEYFLLPVQSEWRSALERLKD